MYAIDYAKKFWEQPPVDAEEKASYLLSKHPSEIIDHMIADFLMAQIWFRHFTRDDRGDFTPEAVPHRGMVGCDLRSAVFVNTSYKGQVVLGVTNLRNNYPCDENHCIGKLDQFIALLLEGYIKKALNLIGYEQVDLEYLQLSGLGGKWPWTGESRRIDEIPDLRRVQRAIKLATKK